MLKKVSVTYLLPTNKTYDKNRRQIPAVHKTRPLVECCNIGLVRICQQEVEGQQMYIHTMQSCNTTTVRMYQHSSTLIANQSTLPNWRDFRENGTLVQYTRTYSRKSYRVVQQKRRMKIEIQTLRHKANKENPPRKAQLVPLKVPLPPRCAAVPILHACLM